MPWSLTASFVCASIALAARTLLWVPQRALSSLLPWLQSLAAGLLLGDALLHMLPDALTRQLPFASVGTLMVLGVLSLFLIECAARAMRLSSNKAFFTRSNVIADVIHHFVDGIVIGASFSVSVSVGVAVTVAIMLHELPREVSNAGTLMAGGYTREEAFLMTLVTTGAVPMGALTVALLQKPQFIAGSLAFAAGTTLYLACGDLVPALWKATARHPLAPSVGVSAGVLVMWLAASLDPML